MGMKRLSLSSLLFKFRDAPPKPSCHSASSPTHSSSSWPWPSCTHPKTDSFRAAPGGGGGAIYKTVNSVYFDSADSCFTRWSSGEGEEEEEQDSFSTVSDEYCSGEAPLVEAMVRGMRSDRLFFEPGDTSSILEEANKGGDAGTAAGAAGREFFRESVALAVESDDPYRDFRTSMEEMVAAHGLQDWERLEELLLWYLRVNGKKTHGIIVGAFVDLLVGIATSPTPPHPSAASTSSPSSSSSSSSSSPSSSSNISFEIEEITDEHKELGNNGSS